MNKALVFGGSGFLGSHLIDYLEENKWQYLNFDIIPTTSTKWYYRNIKDKHGLIQNKYEENFLNTANVVFNFVSVSDIKACLENPQRAVETNINGTVNILNRIKELEGAKPLFVFASSMYVHNDISGIYGITKRTCEEIIKFYHKQYNIPYLILRYGTIYGPGSPRTNSINKIISTALKTKKISYYGTGEEVREYVHAKDVAKMTVELCQEKYINNTYEITGVNPVKAKDMVRMLKDILGDGYEEEFRNEKILGHYNVVPYSFQPDVAKKYIPETCYSFGAGLLEVVNELSKKEK